MKHKKAGKIMVLAGIVLLSFNFISYLMDKPFFALVILPLGIALVIGGALMLRHETTYKH